MARPPPATAASPTDYTFRYNEGGGGGGGGPRLQFPRRTQSYGSGGGVGGAASRFASAYQQSSSQDPNLLPTLATEGIQTVSDFLLSLPHPRYWPGLVFAALVLDPVRTLISNVIALVTSPRTHRVVLRLSVLATLFWAALFLAILASIGFYRTWVPDVARMEQVHLEYGQSGRVPTAVVDLDRIRGGAGDAGDWFAEEQEYDVSVELLVPISAANLDLGNFMVSIDLVTDAGGVVFHSSRPTILRPSTPSARLLSQFAARSSSLLSSSAGSSVPLPFTSPSLELMTIRLFDRLILHPSPSRIPFSNPAGSPLESVATGRQRIAKAIVKVGREDAEKYWIYGGGHGVGGVVLDAGAAGGAEQAATQPGMVLATANSGAFRSRGELQTVGVALRFDARLAGLRWFLYAHPITSLLVFTALFLAFELLSAITIWTIAAVYTSSLPGLDIDLGSDAQYVRRHDGGGGDGDDGDDDLFRPGLRRARARSPSATPTTTTTAAGGETVTGTATSEDDDVTPRVSDDGGDGDGDGEDDFTDDFADDDAELLAEAQRVQSLRQRRSDGGDGEEDDVRLRDDARLPPPPPRDGPPYRRVLGRLDEETEEETDDQGGGGSVPVARARAAAGASAGTTGGGGDVSDVSPSEASSSTGTSEERTAADDD